MPNQPFDSERSQEAPGQVKVKVTEKVKAMLASAVLQLPHPGSGPDLSLFHRDSATRVRLHRAVSHVAGEKREWP